MAIETPSFNKEEFLTRITNEMQIMLIKNSKLPPESWIKKYAKIFREIIKNSPNLLEEYRKNKNLTLKKLEKLIETQDNTNSTH